MKIYFDTGLLLKLYTLESNSGEAVRLIQSYGSPILFSALQQTELHNAIYRKHARGEIKDTQLKQSLKAIQLDLDQGVLSPQPIDWNTVWHQADDLTKKYVLTTACRTLDILHVAVALQIGVKLFASTDQRQLQLAQKAGMTIVTL